MTAVFEQSRATETLYILILKIVFSGGEYLVLGLLERVLLLVCNGLDTQETDKQEYGNEGERREWNIRFGGENPPQRAGECDEQELLIESDKEQVEAEPSNRVPNFLPEDLPTIVFFSAVPSASGKIECKPSPPQIVASRAATITGGEEKPAL